MRGIKWRRNPWLFCTFLFSLERNASPGAQAKLLLRCVSVFDPRRAGSVSAHMGVAYVFGAGIFRQRSLPRYWQDFVIGV